MALFVTNDFPLHEHAVPVRWKCLPGPRFAAGMLCSRDGATVADGRSRVFPIYPTRLRRQAGQPCASEHKGEKCDLDVHLMDFLLLVSC